MFAPTLTINQIQDKLLKRIDVGNNNCWNWTGAKNKSGYGYWTKGLHQPMWRVHRLMWALTHNESMPRTKKAFVVIDHICNNKLCCNPKHLQKITQSENIKRNPARDGSHIGFHLSTHKVQNGDIKYYPKKHSNGNIFEYPSCLYCMKYYNNNKEAWRKQRQWDKINLTKEQK